MRLKLSIGGLVLALCGAAAQADELYGNRSAVSLGRLFLTAEQRRSLDQQRLLVPQGREVSEEESSAPALPPKKKTTSFGLISSGDRAPLIWAGRRVQGGTAEIDRVGNARAHRRYGIARR